MGYRHIGKPGLWLSMVVLWTCAGMAWAQSVPAAAVTKLDAATGAPAAGQQLSVRNDEYVLHRGDDLQIRVYNLPELSAEVRIRPDGKISLLLLNDIDAAGLTATQLGQSIADAYSKTYRDPRVTVMVRNFVAQTVYVGGEVAQPGAFPMPGRLSLSSALFHAGGLKETAQAGSVMLLRDGGNGRPEIKKFNLKDILGGRQEDVKLQPYDVVFVPRSKVARVDLFVKQYMRDLLPISVSAGFSYLLGGQIVP